jgi:hypothetical protein
MKKRTLIAILGIWVALIPSLGLPSSWKHWVIVVSGLAITVVALKRKYVVVEDTSNMEIPFEASKEKVSNSSNSEEGTK